MNSKNNPYTSDYDDPVYVARLLLRLSLFSMFFMVFWKTLFSKRVKKEHEMHEYMQN